MAVTYKIDGNDILTSYGIRVESVEGLLDIAQRKEPTEHNWQDEDGAEAYTDAADIVTEPRDIVMRCRIHAASYSTLKTNLATFQSMLRASGTRSLAISYHAGTLTVYQRDAIRPRLITPPGGNPVVAKFTMNLREP